MDQETQREIQAISEPVLEETIARLSNAGLPAHAIAQSLILTGAGLLAGALGPKGAGYSLEAVADATARWIRQIAEATEARKN